MDDDSYDDDCDDVVVDDVDGYDDADGDSYDDDCDDDVVDDVVVVVDDDSNDDDCDDNDDGYGL